MNITTERPLGVICAMESEAAQLIAALEEPRTETVCGCTFHAGTLCGVPAVVVRCGIGKVNAARITQAMIDRFSPGAVVNSGIAGGVGEGLHVGDVVIGTGLSQHDFDVSALGYVKGYLFEGEPGRPTVFRADPALCAAVRSAAQAAAPDRGVHEGVIVSGDVFVAQSETKRALREDFSALAAEMEGAALAQTAYYAGVPFAVLRVISDLADGDSPESYDTFEQDTADLSAAVIRRLAKDLSGV